MSGYSRHRLLQLRVRPPSPNHTLVAEPFPRIVFDRANLNQILWCNHLLPLQPELPAIGHGVCEVNIQNARPLPVTAPPGSRMETRHAWLPPGIECVRHGPFKLAQ